MSVFNDQEKRVEEIVSRIFAVAVRDTRSGEEEWEHSLNTGKELNRRQALESLRFDPRRGDARAYRQIYRAVRFLLKTEPSSKVQPDEE